jgi:hypothetical protein
MKPNLKDRRSHFISYNLVETFMEVNVAKLSQEIKIIVRNLKEQLLDIIDESKSMKFLDVLVKILKPFPLWNSLQK